MFPIWKVLMWITIMGFKDIHIRLERKKVFFSVVELGWGVRISGIRGYMRWRDERGVLTD